MIIQPFNYIGIDWKSAIKITGVNITNGNTADLYNVELQINRYTDISCEYDIEQFTKSFNDVSVSDIQTADLTTNFENLLISSGTLEGATIVS